MDTDLYIWFYGFLIGTMVGWIIRDFYRMLAEVKSQKEKEEAEA